MRIPRLSLPLRYGAILVILACVAPTGYRVDQQIYFETIDAPGTIAAPGPLIVNLRLLHGACHDKIRVLTTATPGFVTLEAHAEYYLAARYDGCPDIGVWKDTTISIQTPTAGELIVRGAQPHGVPPLDVIVTVTPN